MVISLKRLKLPLIGILVFSIVSVSLWMIIKNKAVQPVMGGYLHSNDKSEQDNHNLYLILMKQVTILNDSSVHPSSQH